MKGLKLSRIKTSHLIAGLMVLVLIEAGILVFRIVYNHYFTTNQTVEFMRCGKLYTIDRVVIEGVDLTQKFEKYLSIGGQECFHYPAPQPLGVKIINEAKGIYDLVIYAKNDPEQASKPFSQSTDKYRINTNKNAIYEISAFDGSNYPIDSFK